MPYLVILAVGLLFLVVGLGSTRLLMKSVQKNANETPAESDGQMRDQIPGFALFCSWISIALGLAVILLSAFLWGQGAFG